MNNEINQAGNKIGGLEPSPNRSLTLYNPPKQVARFGRDTLTALHGGQEGVSTENLGDTPVAKGFRLGKRAIEGSLDAGVKTFSAASTSIIDMAKENSNKKGVRSLMLGGLGSIFGLSALKGLLGAPKALEGHDADEKKAPILLKATKWIAGGSIAMGAIRGILGGAGITNPALVIGILSYLGLNGLVNTYENENSISSRLLKMLGLKDKVKSLTDDIRVDQIMPN